MLVKVLKTFLKWFCLFRKFQIFRAYKSYDPASKNVLVLYPDKWKKLLQYFYSDSLVSDLALVEAVIKTKGDYRIKFGTNAVEKITDSLIFYNISSRFNANNYKNYNHAIIEFIDLMEKNRNTCIPSRRDVLFWENKTFMHQEFDRLGIKTPKTLIFNLNSSIAQIDFSYPFLVKEVHSKGAEGIYKINNVEELSKTLQNPKLLARNSDVLIQNLLDINKDLRVVCIGDQIFYHHWRLNDEKGAWKPTTYKKGSQGDFENFPEQWRTHILDEFKKLNIVTGGFDMAWENNDMTQAPSILEISPSYFPNPKPPSNIKVPYGDFKHKLRWFDSWEKQYIENAFVVKHSVIKESISRIND